MVLSNVDPLQQGRLLVQMAGNDVFPSSWAMPCFPFTGRNMGWWALPQIGAGVWLEFEQGDLDYPIWSGCWFGGSDELPDDALAAPPLLPNIVIQSQTQNKIVISDIPGVGGISLKTRTGAEITIDDLGITISNGKGASIKMIGPTVVIETSGPISVKGATVTINDGALSVI
jgi:uncharacterized protein involved in type VI secretion and phage assembly